MLKSEYIPYEGISTRSEKFEVKSGNIRTCEMTYPKMANRNSNGGASTEQTFDNTEQASIITSVLSSVSDPSHGICLNILCKKEAV